LVPQHATVPSARTAQVCVGPADTIRALARPCAGTGVRRSTSVPSPRNPNSFDPQHATVPSLRRTHVCLEPALIDTALVRPLTTTGVRLEAVEPFPS
jgi:hypothetical protein